MVFYRCWFGLAVRGREAVAARSRVAARGTRGSARPNLGRVESLKKPDAKTDHGGVDVRWTNSMSWFTTRGSHSSTPILRNTLITTAASRGMRRSTERSDAMMARAPKYAGVVRRLLITSESEANIFERYKRSVRLNEKHTVRASPDHGGRCPNARAEAEARR